MTIDSSLESVKRLSQRGMPCNSIIWTYSNTAGNQPRFFVATTRYYACGTSIPPQDGRRISRIDSVSPRKMILFDTSFHLPLSPLKLLLSPSLRLTKFIRHTLTKDDRCLRIRLPGLIPTLLGNSQMSCLRTQSA